MRSAIASILSGATAEYIGSGLVALTTIAVYRFRRVFRRQHVHSATMTLEESKMALRPEFVGRLDQVNASQDCNITLVGSAYLDVKLHPISTKELNADEWSDIDPPDLALGGSCLLVGRAMHRLHNQSSHLYTVLGAGEDMFTRHADALLTKESWIRNEFPRGPHGSRTAVSVHLVQRRQAFTTIITHRGVLGNFTWSAIHDDLLERLGEGGVLYLGGLLKTGLCAGLTGFLKEVPRNVVVVLDHGRLAPGLEHPESLHSIRDAFAEGLIHVHLATYREFEGLCEYPSIRTSRWTDMNDTAIKTRLEGLVRATPLPYACILREASVSNVRAILGNEILSFPTPSPQRGRLTSKSNFTASFLFRLARADPAMRAEERVARAVTDASHSWARE
jgi:hypothetical protein